MRTCDNCKTTPADDGSNAPVLYLRGNTGNTAVRLVLAAASPPSYGDADVCAPCREKTTAVLLEVLRDAATRLGPNWAVREIPPGA